MLDPAEALSCIRYRIAYCEAARLAEMARFDHSWGREFAARIENQSETILAEVVRRIGDQNREVIQEGVEDALAGRRTKW
jgi:hypothetical protein